MKKKNPGVIEHSANLAFISKTSHKVWAFGKLILMQLSVNELPGTQQMMDQVLRLLSYTFDTQTKAPGCCRHMGSVTAKETSIFL